MFTYKTLLKIMPEISPEYKCSRCGKDLREESSGMNACRCDQKHHQEASKSGNRFLYTYLQYEGYKHSEYESNKYWKWKW